MSSMNKPRDLVDWQGEAKRHSGVMLMSFDTVRQQKSRQSVDKLIRASLNL